MKNHIRIPALLMVIVTTFSSQAQSTYQEPHRPQIHFTPKEKWMNEPNGMVYYKGAYHLFYQYYPGAMVWGPMHWGHATKSRREIAQLAFEQQRCRQEGKRVLQAIGGEGRRSNMTTKRLAELDQRKHRVTEILQRRPRRARSCAQEGAGLGQLFE